MRTLPSLAACLIVLASCGDRLPSHDAPPEAPVVSPEIFAGLPLLPGSRMAGGSANAAEAVVAVPVPADSVARFYRRVLADRFWDLRGDATDRDGQITLYARSPEGRPMWIIVRPAGASRANVSVVATAVDSSAAGR
jgi:hypothetical protein